jgi:hypothetical protein
MPAMIINVAAIIGRVISSPRKMIAIIALNSGVVARIGSVVTEQARQARLKETDTDKDQNGHAG